ncbi:MAG: polymer-forming cytoskeletal protein [Alphaproteobacteria bacterium]
MADARVEHAKDRRSGETDPSFLKRQARRSVDIPNLTYDPRDQASRGDRSRDGVLQVGRDIVLSGEITTCDTLVVQGRVEATSFEGRSLEIADAGTFQGSAQVETARICGRFEGDLVVRERLSITRNGRVAGCVRYGTLDVENGGELSGNVEAQTKEQ